MVDYGIDGPTYQAVADQIMDDVPDIPSPHLRILVDYDTDRGELFYTVESHSEDREKYHAGWGSFYLTNSLEFSDESFEHIHDFLAGALKESTGEIPLMYNGTIVRENPGELKAFKQEDGYYPTGQARPTDLEPTPFLFKGLNRG